MSRAPDPLAALVETIAERVADRVVEMLPELIASMPAHAPRELLTRKEMAAQLSISVHHLDRLRGRGLPAIWVGDSPRFRASAVLAWLEAQEPGSEVG